MPPLLGEIIFKVNGFDRTDLGTNTTINTLVRVNEVLIRLWIGLDAIDRADLDTGGVLYPDAWFGNNVRHWYYSFTLHVRAIAGARQPPLVAQQVY